MSLQRACGKGSLNTITEIFFDHNYPPSVYIPFTVYKVFFFLLKEAFPDKEYTDEDAGQEKLGGRNAPLCCESLAFGMLLGTGHLNKVGVPERAEKHLV